MSGRPSKAAHLRLRHVQAELEESDAEVLLLQTGGLQALQQLLQHVVELEPVRAVQLRGRDGGRSVWEARSGSGQGESRARR